MASFMNYSIEDEWKEKLIRYASRRGLSQSAAARTILIAELMREDELYPQPSRRTVKKK